MSYRLATSRHDYRGLRSGYAFRFLPGNPACPVRPAQDIFLREASHLPTNRSLTDLSAIARVADAFNPVQFEAIQADTPIDLIVSAIPYAIQTARNESRRADPAPLNALARSPSRVPPAHAVMALSAQAPKIFMGANARPLERFLPDNQPGFIGWVAELRGDE